MKARRSRPELERFMARVQKTDSCWLWTGYVRPSGYAIFARAGTTVRAHRWAYQFFAGPIPEGMVLDHLCRVRHCVNPDHLEPVTNRENILRGVGITAVNARATHCVNGHEFTPDNTRWRTGSREGQRDCNACHRTSRQKPMARTG